MIRKNFYNVRESPIIIVPKGYQPRPFREVAAVAWDGSRHAARALTDAMQILETKKKLFILTAQAEKQSTRYGRFAWAWISKCIWQASRRRGRGR